MKIQWRRKEKGEEDGKEKPEGEDGEKKPVAPAKGTVEKYIKEYLNESPKVASSTSQ